MSDFTPGVPNYSPQHIANPLNPASPISPLNPANPNGIYQSGQRSGDSGGEEMSWKAGLGLTVGGVGALGGFFGGLMKGDSMFSASDSFAKPMGVALGGAVLGALVLGGAGYALGSLIDG